MPLSYTSRCGFSLFALAWLLSVHIQPWITFHAEATAMAALSMLVADQLLTRQQLALPTVGLWLAGLVLIPWLQFAAGINFFAGDALVSSLYLAGVLGATFLGFSYASSVQPSGKALLGFMHALWVAALLSACIGFLQWLKLESVLGVYAVENDLNDSRALGNLGQPNQLATLLLIGMAALAFVYESRVIGRIAFGLGIGFLSFVLVLTQSRAGYLSVLVVAVFLIWKRRQVALRLSAKVVVFWCILFVSASALLPYLNKALLLTDARGLASQASVNERYGMWQQIAYAISQAPWTGYGWNQTATAQFAAAAEVPGSTPVTYAHNLILDLIAWNGVPLGLILIGALAYWFMTRLKRAVRPEAVFAMAGLLPFTVHSMLEYPHAYAYFLLTAGVLAGVVEASTGSGKVVAINIRRVWAVLGIWTVFGSYFCYEYLLVEQDYQVARHEILRIGTTPDNYQRPRIRMSTHMAALLEATRQQPVRGMNAELINNMRQAALRFPNTPLTFRYALALGLNGDAAGASKQMAVARGIYGERRYQHAKAHLRTLQQEKYPELAAVQMP